MSRRRRWSSKAGGLFAGCFIGMRELGKLSGFRLACCCRIVVSTGSCAIFCCKDFCSVLGVGCRGVVVFEGVASARSASYHRLEAISEVSSVPVVQLATGDDPLSSFEQVLLAV